MRLSCFITTCLLAVSVWAQPTARQWNQEVTAGWNLGNQLECPPSGWNNESTDFGNPANAMQAETAWGNPVVTQQMLQAVKEAGFNAVRIPVRWQCHITDAENMTIDPLWLQRVKEVVGYALAYDMKVIINSHHDMWLESRPTYHYKEYNNQKLTLLWTNIANAFKDYGYDLAFAGTNEVHVPNNWNAPTAENLSVQNSYNQTFVDAVRATGGNNLKRHLVIQTYTCNADYGVNGQLIVPSDVEGNGKEYMSVEFHYYNPYDYCSGTSASEGGVYYWGQAYAQYGKISDSKETAMRNAFQQVTDAWGSQGLGVVMGEWGVSDHWLTTYKERMHENMTYYCKTLIIEARQQGISTFVWDNNTFGNGTEKYGIFDRHNNMSLVADWILTGIQQGIATGISSPNITSSASSLPAKKVLYQGKVCIWKGDKLYNLQGQELQKGVE